MQWAEVAHRLLPIAALLLGLFLAEFRNWYVRREQRIRRLGQTEERKHNFTLAVDARITEMVQSTIKTSIAADMGMLRRLLTEHLGDQDRMLREIKAMIFGASEIAKKDTAKILENQVAIRESIRIESTALKTTLQAVNQGVLKLSEATTDLFEALQPLIK